MKVAADPQKHVSHNGADYYFCSTRCVSRFSEDPGKFLTGSSAASVPVNEVGPVGTIYTCPMHPEIRQDHPGDCPKCGMTLEPEMPGLEDEENPELRSFERRFWWTLPLTIVVFLLAMFGHRQQWMDMRVQSWVELVLSLPIVLWAGFPFFDRGWRSVVNRSPNMWTLIGLGTGAAFLYSVVATVFP
jgi:Cu+-exporting ATPase